MKINRIGSILKKQKRIILYNGEGEQWISDGCAIYPLLNMPFLNEKSACTVFGIDEKQAAKIAIYTRDIGELIGLVEDIGDEDDIDRDSFFINITVGDDVIIPLDTAQGIIYINAMYLVPIVDTGYLGFYIRKTKGGKPVVIVKDGLKLLAAILPYSKVTEALVEQLKGISVLTAMAFERTKAEMAVQAEEVEKIDQG